MNDENAVDGYFAQRYRQTVTQRKGKESLIEWIPEIPESGNYAVYASYQSFPNSTEQALYTIHHAGGETTIAVNQTMGGGTWIYLGNFKLRHMNKPMRESY